MFLSLSRQSPDLQDHIWSRINQVMDVQGANSKGRKSVNQTHDLRLFQTNLVNSKNLH
jgi:hypothetical protein